MSNATRTAWVSLMRLNDIHIHGPAPHGVVVAAGNNQVRSASLRDTAIEQPRHLIAMAMCRICDRAAARLKEEGGMIQKRDIDKSEVSARAAPGFSMPPLGSPAESQGTVTMLRNPTSVRPASVRLNLDAQSRHGKRVRPSGREYEKQVLLEMERWPFGHTRVSHFRYTALSSSGTSASHHVAAINCANPRLKFCRAGNRCSAL
jgi:hypothetical protein